MCCVRFYGSLVPLCRTPPRVGCLLVADRLRCLPPFRTTTVCLSHAMPFCHAVVHVNVTLAYASLNGLYFRLFTIPHCTVDLTTNNAHRFRCMVDLPAPFRFHASRCPAHAAPDACRHTRLVASHHHLALHVRLPHVTHFLPQLLRIHLPVPALAVTLTCHTRPCGYRTPAPYRITVIPIGLWLRSRFPVPLYR